MGLRRRVEAARALAIACLVILLFGVNAHVWGLTSTRRRETDIAICKGGPSSFSNFAMRVPISATPVVHRLPFWLNADLTVSFAGWT
jgi:hypothetical protein